MFNDAIITFLNESYEEQIKRKEYTVGELEIIRQYLDDLIDNINK